MNDAQPRQCPECNGDGSIGSPAQQCEECEGLGEHLLGCDCDGCISADEEVAS